MRAQQPLILTLYNAVVYKRLQFNKSPRVVLLAGLTCTWAGLTSSPSGVVYLIWWHSDTGDTGTPFSGPSPGGSETHNMVRFKHCVGMAIDTIAAYLVSRNLGSDQTKLIYACSQS